MDAKDRQSSTTSKISHAPTLGHGEPLLPNYLILEKLVLTSIYAARQLRHYFHAHKIEVLIGYPIKQIILRPEKSGCLEKWTIKLGEHDIDYRSCTDIKA